MTPETNGRLPTGIEIIDRKLGGGLPLGSVTALSADPASQSELFLYEFAATRRTVYLSTIRTGEMIEDALENREQGLDEVDAIRLDDETPIAHAGKVLEDLPDEMNLVVDPVVVLEEGDAGRYRRFLADLKQWASTGENIVLLHCLRDDHTPKRRRDTVHVTDLVLDLSTEVRGDSVENRLTVPKFRGGQSMDEVVKLDLTTEIEVDMSRNII